MRIEFSPPDITEADIAAVSETLRSGWITSGARVQEFESKLAAWCQTPRVAAVSSATAAMECILALLSIGPGDEVVTSAYTYTASASVICHAGATPVLVDVAPGGYHLDPAALEAAVSERTKAVIAVDVAGVLADYDAIRKALRSPGLHRRFRPRKGTLQERFEQLPIVADGAHSFGATYHGRPAGSVADFTAFSFHAVKNLTTAEGGALTWRPGLFDAETDELVHRRAKLYSLHGQDKDALAKTTLGNWEYDVVAPLYKCNMTDMAAALGLSQLGRYRDSLARRRELMALYSTRLAAGAEAGGYALDVISQDDGAGSLGSCHLLLVRLLGRDDAFRRRLIEGLARRGVAANVHYKPLPLLTAYAALGFDAAAYPNAMAQYENEVTLPLHTLLGDEDVAYVCDSFAEAYAECAQGA